LTAVSGLCRYLVKQKRINAPIEKQKHMLADVYEAYLHYYATARQVNNRRIKSIRRVLVALQDYLENKKIKLTVLFHQRQILKRDLAPLVVGAHMFAQAKPPTFLRADELKKLFDNIDLSSQTGLRTYAMLQLAYTLGLRPIEICQITFDDISFGKAELNINWRKFHNPLKLPLAEVTIKAIAAYIIGARPQSALRTLFLSLVPPYGSITPTTVHHYFKTAMQNINPAASVYWLRHTYAQNLLQAGVSLFEIKELLGHDSIEATRKYLLIHIKLMREVLFDE